MTKEGAVKIVNQVGEDFGWQMGKVGANYENGYMKAIRDCKFALQNAKDDFVEVNKMIVTNADRIRNMSDEELADFITMFDYCEFCRLFSNEECNKFHCANTTNIWLKAKVE